MHSNAMEESSSPFLPLSLFCQLLTFKLSLCRREKENVSVHVCVCVYALSRKRKTPTERVRICQDKGGIVSLSRESVKKHCSTAQITLRVTLWRQFLPLPVRIGEIRETINDFTLGTAQLLSAGLSTSRLTVLKSNN